MFNKHIKQSSTLFLGRCKLQGKQNFTSKKGKNNKSYNAKWMERVWISRIFILLCRDFQPFPRNGTHKLITKILKHTKKYIFCRSDKNIGIILIHAHWTAAVVLAAVISYLTV